MLLSFQPQTAHSVTMGNEKGGNSLGVSAQTQTWFAGVMEWDSDADDVSSQAAVDMLYSEIMSLAHTKELLLPFQFPNDAGFLQSPLQGTGQDNLLSLKEVSRKYDSSQTFQKLQNDGFLLSKT